MRMLNISSLDDLVANSMDILEPAPVDGNGNKREDGMALAYFITNGIQCLNLSHAFDVPPLKCMDIMFMGYDLLFRCIFVFFF